MSAFETSKVCRLFRPLTHPLRQKHNARQRWNAVISNSTTPPGQTRLSHGFHTTPPKLRPQPQPQPQTAPKTTPSLQTNQVTISIQHPWGRESTQIVRSYPQARSEKLVQGLERLLSDIPTPTPTPTPTPPPSSSLPSPDQAPQPHSRHRWRLADTLDAIDRVVVIKTEEAKHTDALRDGIHQASKDLDHEPHCCFESVTDADGREYAVYVITCTTHVPRGLSLKDVKLADRIEEVIRSMDLDGVGLPSSLDERVLGPVCGRLRTRNLEAAEAARRNPASKCNLDG